MDPLDFNIETREGGPSITYPFNYFEKYIPYP